MLVSGPYEHRMETPLPKPDQCPVANPGVFIRTTNIALEFPFNGVVQHITSSSLKCPTAKLYKDIGEILVSLRKTGGNDDSDRELEELNHQTNYSKDVGDSASEILTAMCAYCIDNHLYLGE